MHARRPAEEMRHRTRATGRWSAVAAWERLMGGGTDTAASLDEDGNAAKSGAGATVAGSATTSADEDEERSGGCDAEGEETGTKEVGRRLDECVGAWALACVCRCTCTPCAERTPLRASRGGGWRASCGCGWRAVLPAGHECVLVTNESAMVSAVVYLRSSAAGGASEI